MKAIYLDCFSGISGNMFIGALLDAGLPLAYLEYGLKKLPVANYKLQVERAAKCGVSACHFDVKVRQWFQPSRNLNDIVTIIDDSELSDRVKNGAKKAFSRLAEAEAKVHGSTLDQVHFHEVGAVDAIVDVVGTMLGLEYFGIERVYASSLHVGSGFVKCSHGRMPVPAPATAELLKGVPFYSTEIKGELVTPTGAALATTLAESFGRMPPSFRAETIAYGAGTMDLEIANVLRVYVGEISQGPSGDHENLAVLETNIDDMNPQIYGYVMDKLLENGAMDVYYTPIMMKKNRPAVKTTVIATRDKIDAIARILFKETSTIGVRILPCDNIHLSRQIITVETEWGPVRVKLAKKDDQVLNIAPEYEDCRQIAEKYGVPLKNVQQQAAGRAGNV